MQVSVYFLKNLNTVTYGTILVNCKASEKSFIKPVPFGFTYKNLSHILTMHMWSDLYQFQKLWQIFLDARQNFR